MYGLICLMQLLKYPLTFFILVSEQAIPPFLDIIDIIVVIQIFLISLSLPVSHSLTTMSAMDHHMGSIKTIWWVDHCCTYESPMEFIFR